MTSFWDKLPKELVVNGISLTFDWELAVDSQYVAIVNGRITFLKPSTFRYLGPNSYMWDALGNPNLGTNPDFVIGAAELTRYITEVMNPQLLEKYWESYLGTIRERVARCNLLDPRVKAAIDIWIGKEHWRKGSLVVKATTWADFQELGIALDFETTDIQVKEDRAHIRKTDYDSVVHPVKPIVIMRTPRTGKLPSNAWRIPGLVVILPLYLTKSEDSDESSNLLS